MTTPNKKRKLDGKPPKTYVPDDKDLKKPKKSTSYVWEYVKLNTEYPKYAMCTICKKWLSYRTTTTNLSNHLQCAHAINAPKLKEKDMIDEVDSKKLNQFYSKKGIIFLLKKRTMLWLSLLLWETYHCIW